MKILITALVVVTVIGVGIGAWTQLSQEKYTNEKSITLSDTNEAQSENMSVRLSDIVPGDKSSYTVNLSAVEGDGFDFTLDFTPNGSVTLAPFIDVEILLEGESVGKAKLSEYLSGAKAEFSGRFNATSKLKIEIVYSMDIGVGDEAQNTTAEFNVNLTAKR